MSYAMIQEENSGDEDIDAELGLSEDHFSRPEGLFGFSNIEELEMAIENCKEMIFETPESSEKRKRLVRKLVQLRLKLQDCKEGPVESPPQEKLMLGHRFCKGQLEPNREYCENCCGLILGVLQTWYTCHECGFKCHNKCLNSIIRKCPFLKVQECIRFNLEVCPESGLASQKYRCAECHKRILFKVGYAAPRRCDYNGLYYCSYCHWDNEVIIPARIVHNWDYCPKKVCRVSLQFLRLMMTKPVLNLEALNPSLFSYIEELSHIKKLRKEILVMKQYFLSCHAALEKKLLLLLKDRQHFVENSDVYSLQDLVDLTQGVLVPYLEQVNAAFQQHIVVQCVSCQGKGFLCELCQNSELIYPFQDKTIACSECNAVFHRDCYMNKDIVCPKCERRLKGTSC